MSLIRPPAVAGAFYPAEPGELAGMLDTMLDAARTTESTRVRSTPPAALILPHAGYVYSGSTAARGYSLVEGSGVQRVVLLGPTHRVPVSGLALPSVEAFATPLGRVRVEQDATHLPQVVIDDAPHAMEHSLEVHLPFVQKVLGDVAVVPFAVGRASPAEVAEVIDACWGGSETLVLISSDLSHYLPYAQAQHVDEETLTQILAAEGPITPEQACGSGAINGLLHLVEKRRLRPELVAACNSGDTAGDRRRVVGYATVAFDEMGPKEIDIDEVMA